LRFKIKKKTKKIKKNEDKKTEEKKKEKKRGEKKNVNCPSWDLNPRGGGR